MIRTRDFLLFGLVVVFLSGGIGMTILNDLWRSSGQMAAAIEFSASPDPAGAEAVIPDKGRTEVLERLRTKLAKGEGLSAGAPVFTSVDDLASSAPTVTDQTAPEAIVMGRTLDGQPLMSDDLWRYVGFSSNDQIGTALNGVPIYGVRADALPLDPCGGADEGTGYRYFIRPGEKMAEGCF